MSNTQATLDEARQKLAHIEAALFDAENSLAKSGEALDDNRAKQRAIELKIAELKSDKAAMGVAEGLLVAEVGKYTQAVTSLKQDAARAGMEANTAASAVLAVGNEPYLEPDSAVEPEPVVDQTPESESTNPVVEPTQFAPGKEDQ